MVIFKKVCLKKCRIFFETWKHTWIIFLVLAKKFRLMTNFDIYYELDESQCGIPLFSTLRRPRVKKRQGFGI